MNRKLIPCLLALALTASLTSSALAAVQPPAVCYPNSVTRSEDGSEIRKTYDLDPEDDPAGIPRSDFEQEGFCYTLIDLLKQEAPSMRSGSTPRLLPCPARARTWARCWPCCPRPRRSPLRTA